MQWGHEECKQNLLGNLYGKCMHKWEENTLKWILKKTEVCEGIRWIQLAQDKTHWPALLNTVMSFLSSQKAGIS
jgi:hypothetical protein